MKLGIFLIVLGSVFLLEGGARIALLGWPGLSGIAFALPCFYWGIKRIRKLGIQKGEEVK